MRQRTIWFLSCLFVLGMASLVWADDPTSQFVSLAPIPSSLIPSSTGVAVQFEVWDQATAGTMIFSEAHTVDTGGDSTITNDTGFADLLLGRPTGLNPANFPAGSSRYLDVTVGGIAAELGVGVGTIHQASRSTAPLLDGSKTQGKVF